MDQDGGLGSIVRCRAAKLEGNSKFLLFNLNSDIRVFKFFHSLNGSSNPSELTGGFQSPASRSSIEKRLVHAWPGQSCVCRYILQSLNRGGNDSAFSYHRVQIEKYHFEIFGSCFERKSTSVFSGVRVWVFIFTECNLNLTTLQDTR